MSTEESEQDTYPQPPPSKRPKVNETEDMAYLTPLQQLTADPEKNSFNELSPSEKQQKRDVP